VANWLCVHLGGELALHTPKWRIGRWRISRCRIALVPILHLIYQRAPWNVRCPWTCLGTYERSTQSKMNVLF